MFENRELHAYPLINVVEFMLFHFRILHFKALFSDGY